MSTKYIVNNISGQTINGQPIDPKYKVFTALLTQTGSDNPYGENGGTAAGNYPELTIGITYYIASNFQLESDFTNVGAPNNNEGTYFVATGTTPASWGTYALLQYNTGAPVATVLENTIGNIWFAYDTIGRYLIQANIDTFTQNKTYTNLQVWGDDNATPKFGLVIWVDTNTMYLNVLNKLLELNNGIGGGTILTSIEIRVYN